MKLTKKQLGLLVGLVLTAATVLIKTFTDIDVELPAGLSETLTEQLVEIM